MIRKRHRLENPVTGRRSTTGVPIGELDRAGGPHERPTTLHGHVGAAS
jgi:hypothetical protein